VGVLLRYTTRILVARKSSSSIRVVESPVVLQVSSGPSKTLNIAIAGILGLFVGVFAAFFKDYMGGE
jgi:uncharacterized protein involved in exopolysaccharide biosynthesis